MSNGVPDKKGETTLAPQATEEAQEIARLRLGWTVRENEIARLKRELAAREREACTAEHRTTCSFASSAIGTPALPFDNDGMEQYGFENWARKAGLDMTQHTLHWLFLNPKTAAARDAWRGALQYVKEKMVRPDGGANNG